MNVYLITTESENTIGFSSETTTTVVKAQSEEFACLYLLSEITNCNSIEGILEELGIDRANITENKDLFKKLLKDNYTSVHIEVLTEIPVFNPGHEFFRGFESLVF